MRPRNKLKRPPIPCHRLLDYIQTTLNKYRVAQFNEHVKRFRFRSKISTTIQKNWESGNPNTAMCIDQLCRWGDAKRLCGSLIYALGAMKDKYGTDFQIVTDNISMESDGKWVVVDNSRMNKFMVVLHGPNNNR